MVHLMSFIRQISACRMSRKVRTILSISSFTISQSQVPLTISSTLAVQTLRTLKLLGWETPALAQLSQKRDAELKWIFQGKLLDLLLGIVPMILPLCSLLATFGTHVSLRGRIERRLTNVTTNHRRWSWSNLKGIPGFSGTSDSLRLWRITLLSFLSRCSVSFKTKSG